MRKFPKLFLALYLIIFTTWIYYVNENQIFYYIQKHAWAVITMIFGSFIAGSSPEGSAAIAYPVFTLLLDIKPDVARNFAFAIQSIGMTAASLLILELKVKVDWNYIKYVSLGGALGLVFGIFYVAPLISPPIAKLFFVSLWLSFGIVLWKENAKPSRKVYDSIKNFKKSDAIKLLIFGIIGGIISSIFGTGINIFTFCLMTIYFGISEKVAVPSSIIIMSLETILGFFIHKNIINDFQQEAFEMWIASIPFVIIFAPLGSYIMSKMPRNLIANFLNFILLIQFLGALWVIKPNGKELLFCGITLLSGLILFFLLSKNPRKQSV